ncbi:DUF1343 domain-containing protein [Candidatus Poribacteria bacterium]|nr:DUF1343 domain-containing protein [Candidatus Poribacteria bacterium]
MVKTGLKVLMEDKLELIGDKALGLITNPTGVNEKLEDNISLFLARDKVNLKAIFAPEHGLWAAIQDLVEVSSFKHEGVSIPIYSLYGKNRKPTPEMLEGIDVLIFDIQDVGVKFYTFVSTMAIAMEACAENGVSFMVLDRPNPITGTRIEGPMLDPAFKSFIGYFTVTLRHGLTIGELALLYREIFQLSLRLEVVKMEGWNREMWFDDTGLEWIMPSPNMPTLDTAIVYPGTCLFEGTNISEGRGTTKPFEFIGAPWMDGRFIADKLNSLNMEGVRFRPVQFIPTFSKYQDETCSGMQIHVINRSSFRPVKTALAMIETIMKSYPDDFQWRNVFDMLMGTDKVRKAMIDGDHAVNITRSWEDELKGFAETRKGYLIY